MNFLSTSVTFFNLFVESDLVDFTALLEIRIFSIMHFGYLVYYLIESYDRFNSPKSLLNFHFNAKCPTQSDLYFKKLKLFSFFFKFYVLG